MYKNPGKMRRDQFAKSLNTKQRNLYLILGVIKSFIYCVNEGMMYLDVRTRKITLVAMWKMIGEGKDMKRRDQLGGFGVVHGKWPELSLWLCEWRRGGCI